jgi:hypothetical protein
VLTVPFLPYPSQFKSTTSARRPVLSDQQPCCQKKKLRAPRLGMRHKKDDNASLASPKESTISCPSSQDDKVQKKRRIHASQVQPPVELSVVSDNSDASHSYSARRSRCLAARNEVDGDGDKWIECLVVNIKDWKRNTHKSRLLFYSNETQRGM